MRNISQALEFFLICFEYYFVFLIVKFKIIGKWFYLEFITSSPLHRYIISIYHEYTKSFFIYEVKTKLRLQCNLNHTHTYIYSIHIAYSCFLFLGNKIIYIDIYMSISELFIIYYTLYSIYNYEKL